MGMSTHITAFIPDNDPEYQRQKKVLLACHEAKVSLPAETAKYFGVYHPDLYLLEEKLQVKLEKGVHYKEYNADMEQGFEIDLDKLPKGVTKVRFYNSF